MIFSNIIQRGVIIESPQRIIILVEISSGPLDFPGFRDLIIHTMSSFAIWMLFNLAGVK